MKVIVSLALSGHIPTERPGIAVYVQQNDVEEPSLPKAMRKSEDPPLPDYGQIKRSA